MRPFLHLLSVVLVLPIVILASGFVILGRAIAAHSLPGILNQLLTDALWLVPWGLLAACAAILVVAAGGFFVRSRWLADLCVAALGIFSTLIVLTLTLSHSGFSVGQLPFLVPGVISSIIGLWFAVTERGRVQSAGAAA